MDAEEKPFIPNGAEIAAILRWQVEYVRQKPLALPHEIREATEEAINSGEIVTRKNNRYLS